MRQNQDNRDSEAGNCFSYTAPPAAATKSKLPLRPFTKKGKSASSTTTFGCKVVLAKRNGKSFNELNQTYISLNEDSANVGYITEKVQEKWGDVVLVAGNGLAIQDEEGPRGRKSNIILCIAYIKLKLRLICYKKGCSNLSEALNPGIFFSSHRLNPYCI